MIVFPSRPSLAGVRCGHDEQHLLQNGVQNASNLPLTPPPNANKRGFGELTRTRGIINPHNHRYHSPPPPQPPPPPPLLLPAVYSLAKGGRSGARRTCYFANLRLAALPLNKNRTPPESEQRMDALCRPEDTGATTSRRVKSVSWIYPDHRIIAAPQLRPAPNPAHAMTSPDFTCFGQGGGRKKTKQNITKWGGLRVVGAGTTNPSPAQNLTACKEGRSHGV